MCTHAAAAASAAAQGSTAENLARSMIVTVAAHDSLVGARGEARVPRASAEEQERAISVEKVYVPRKKASRRLVCRARRGAREKSGSERVSFVARAEKFN